MIQALKHARRQFVVTTVTRDSVRPSQIKVTKKRALRPAKVLLFGGIIGLPRSAGRRYGKPAERRDRTYSADVNSG